MPYPELKGLLTDIGTEAAEMLYFINNFKNLCFKGFLIYTFSTTNRVVKHGRNNQFDFSEHPTLFSVAKNALSIIELV